MTTLLQLEAFVAVVDMGSFDAAARRLGIAQSAISRHIRTFEGRFPFELFDRRGRSARLTLNGAEVLAQVRTVLRQRDELVERLGRKESLRRSLRLGVTELAAFTWLPVFAESVRRAYPMVRLDIQVGLGGRLHELLRQGQLDLVMVPNAFPSAELQRLPLALVRNGWYCAKSVAQGARRLALVDLPRFTLLAPGADSAAALLVNDWFRKHGIVPASVLRCDSLAALAGMAAAGLGIARLPSAVAGELVARGVIREVEITPAAPKTPYVTLVRRDAVTPFYREIARLAREQCDYDTRFQDWHEKHSA